MPAKRWLAWLAATGLVAFGLLLAVVAWYQFQLRPVDRKSQSVQTYVLVAGTKVDKIAEQLAAKHLIRNQQAFVLYVTTTGRRTRLQAGSYELSPADSSQQIAEIIVGGRVAANKFVVPEGVTNAKLQRLAVERGISPTEFAAALGDSYPNRFLAGRPPAASLEGYLFPDSYAVSKPVQSHELVQSMLNNFGQQLAGTDIEARYASEALTLHQGVTLASIVEKEVSSDADRAMVAQVFLNRLQAGQALQSDVTVAYAAAQLDTEFNLSLNSPYNTYRVKGLPPGPICNPSLSAMRAVAHPTPNNYLYFLADKQGKTHFAVTLAEHEQNVRKYLR